MKLFSSSQFDTDDLQMIQISFQILTKFYGISFYFSKILTEVALETNICKWFYWNLRKKWWKMPVVVASFSNDESAWGPALLKTVPTTGILIDQIHKFQNSYFKEHLWKLLLFYEKYIV